MKKSTMPALGCGAGALACIALAVHFWKRKQTGGTVACGVLGGCAAAVAAGCTVCSLKKRETLRLEYRETPLLTKLGESADEQESFGHGNIDSSWLQVGQQVEDAEYVGEMKEKPVANGYGKVGQRTNYLMSEQGKAFLKILEGSVKNESGLLIPYNDSNNCATKGYGILLHHGPLTEEDIRNNPPQTEASASIDLYKKIEEYESILNNRTSYIYQNGKQAVKKLALSQVEVDALLCLTYNSPRVGKKVIDAIRDGKSNDDLKAIWLDGNDKASGIGKRRLAEWQLYLEGIYDENPYD